jgi:hypothetical protein
MNSVVQSGYLAVFNFQGGAGAGRLTVFKDVSGSVTQLGSAVTTLTFAAGDVLTFQAAGCALTVNKNGKRIYYFYDTTFTSGGSPGYDQNSAGSVTNSQVSSWRGYSAVQQDGIWNKQGIVIAPVIADLNGATAGVGIQSWSVFQDTNAQILSGTVYKTWLVSDWSNDATSSMYYAESLDGVSWTRRGAAVLANVTNGFVFKNGSTYYMYAQTAGASGTGNMLVYTSSDGINWALQSPSSVLVKGTAGAWDSGSFYNIICVTIVAGTWYGFYNGNNGGAFSVGLATSTDGINWTKYSGNPVISGAVTTGNNIVNVGGTYYLWGAATQPGQGGSVLDPYEAVRYKSTNLTSWSLSSHSLHRSQIFESLNAVTGGVQGLAMLNVGGSTYLYTNSSQGDAVAPQIGQIGLAIAPVPVSSIVLFPEDGASQVATDLFTSGAGDLSSNWVTPTGYTKLQLTAGALAEPSAANTACVMAYTGASFSTNQYSEITLKSLATTSDTFSPSVRTQTGSEGLYSFNLVGPIGSAYAFLQLYKVVSGVSTSFGPVVQITPQIGDVIRLSVITGSDGFPILSIYQNGFLILQSEDYGNSLTTGFPGMVALGVAAVTNAQISLWSGGNTNVTPPYPPPGSNAYSVPDSRVSTATTPNSSRNVQGTLIYDVPKVYSLQYWFDILFNRTQPLPEDCRAAGAPVDCRISPNIPQNSRAPGTYGPGE